MSDTPAAPRRRTAAFGFIFATAVMNSISFGLMIPVLPNLIKQFTGGDTSAASEWNVVFAVSWGVAQFFCGPILGLLSDRVGRRPVLLISIAGLGADFLLMAFAPTLWWLLIGRIVSGVTSASFSTANAYIADVIRPDERAKVFGWMGSAFSFGFLIGPAIGGAMAEVDMRLPFLVASALCAVNFLYGYFILPESLPPERRISRFDWSRANPLGSLRFLRAHGELAGLATISFLWQLAHTVLPAIFVLYTGYLYGWGPGIMGLAMMGTGAMGIIVQTFLVGPVVSRIGERGALLLGSFTGALGFAIYAVAYTPWLYILAMPVFALSSFIQPGLMGLMTRRVEPTAQGQLQGANQSLMGIAGMTGPAIFGLTFAWSVRNDAEVHMPGLAVGIAAALVAAAFLLALRFAKPAAPPVAATAPAE